MLRRAQCLQLSLFDVTATSLAHATSLALPPQRSQPATGRGTSSTLPGTILVPVQRRKSCPGTIMVPVQRHKSCPRTILVLVQRHKACPRKIRNTAGETT